MDRYAGMEYKFTEIKASQWIYLAISCVFLAISLHFYPQALNELHQHWITPDDQDAGYYMLAVALIAGWIRIQSARIDNSHHLLFIGLAVLISLLLWFALALSIKTIALAMILVGWPIFIGATINLQAAYKILLPMLLIGTVFPAWYLFTPYLQTMTLHISTFMTTPFSIPMFIEGNFITIPGGIIHVAGGCAGIKYLQTLMSLAVIFLLIYPIKLRYIPLVFITTLLAALVTNWLRVFILILIGHHLGVDHPIMIDHDWLGWLVFIMVLPGWLWVLNQKRFRPNQLNDKGANLFKAPATSSWQMPRAAIAFLICGFIWITPALLNQSGQSKDANAPTAIDTKQLADAVFPSTLASFNLQGSSSQQDWQPVFFGHDIKIAGIYRQGNTRIDAMAIGYSREKQGEELSNGNNEILDSEIYSKIIDSASGIDNWAITQGSHLVSNQSRIVFYQYRSGDYATASTLRFKLKQASELLAQRELPLIVMYSMICAQNCSKQQKVLENFVQEL